MFTAAMTYGCCNDVAAPHPSGGLWVIEPSRALWERTWTLMAKGMAVYGRDGKPVMRRDGSPRRSTWYRSDMDLAIALFTDPRSRGLTRSDGSMTPGAGGPQWPQIDDKRHGRVSGLHLLPENQRRPGQNVGGKPKNGGGFHKAFQPPAGWNVRARARWHVSHPRL